MLGGGRLFTQTREDDEEIVVALDAATGKTLWSFRYAAPPGPTRARNPAKGPNATPLLAGGTLVTVGFSGLVHALNAADGELRWSYDLESQGAKKLRFGHSASPLEVDGAVVLLTGGKEHGSLALELEDGSVRWQGPPKGVSYASPILVDAPGHRQLVYLSSEEVIALDPATGVLLWTAECRNGWGNNAADPVWLPPDRLWVASQPDDGARLYRLLPPAAPGNERENPSASPSVEVLWHQPRASVHHWNAVPFGDTMITAIGGQGAILAAIDLTTGEILWRERGYPKARLLKATNTKTGDLLLLLDENGTLSLARPGSQGLELLAQAAILQAPAWTVPTLVGGILYLRDQESILALDLRPPRSPAE